MLTVVPPDNCDSPCCNTLEFPIDDFTSDVPTLDLSAPGTSSFNDSISSGNLTFVGGSGSVIAGINGGVLTFSSTGTASGNLEITWDSGGGGSLNLDSLLEIITIVNSNDQPIT